MSSRRCGRTRAAMCGTGCTSARHTWRRIGWRRVPPRVRMAQSRTAKRAIAPAACVGAISASVRRETARPETTTTVGVGL
jgi:hypothetical protein